MHKPAPESCPPALDGQVIAVLRTNHADDYLPVIESIVAGGVRFIELTLTTKGVFDRLPEIRRTFGETAEIGIGTVTSPDQAHRALDLGAQFIVTPSMNLDVVHLVVSRQVPIIAGGLSPTELLAGWRAGATALKVFPASTVQPDYLRQLHGPFPEMQLIPSGGVSIEDVPGWFRAGALAVSLGGPLVGDAFRGGSLAALTERARRVTDLARAAATEHRRRTS
ncbi:2-dehydro-3-deoxyphosphogluconate aldolase/(4S)-4-hydroxy-2-oxoglutarate aldolase [Arthrobacter sp. AG258]|uniref:bifunctional 4-hydroxy-2-oxoglutarate aldolase/2-dehydro-3-deoxy-phosphogluconate aldolase n=1 Tax=Arthrobacter sp. AG258 TaxID=2183899 RepID=UPI00105FC7E0|nr:bifunctional 4-hydroxy-2-oxoglutarate aldolase/2-dehydro-3-deoxy-phosphogluconate aldolase [Arthrobacter sp. AG258]TDT74676.1 2-dehydro-3-deoxyphosphogluconate aldolase/(4S)-4-hydroxy-2-oxoglutarate aldolase [Arthrobacter sp. AG258]